MNHHELAIGAIALWSVPQQQLTGWWAVVQHIHIPYIPGYLAFREMPPLLNALKLCPVRPDLLMVDGQGIAHPRHAGIAAHLGVELDLPTIGCAKKILIGTPSQPLQPQRGSLAWLNIDGQIKGALLRTRTHVQPVVVSIGHRITLPEAICWVLHTARQYRLPEPLRHAHHIANLVKQELKIRHQPPLGNFSRHPFVLRKPYPNDWEEDVLYIASSGPWENPTHSPNPG